MSALEEILADYREAEIAFSVNDIEELTKLRKDVMKDFNKINTIFLVLNPEETAITMLYSIAYKNFSTVSIYSTIDSCLKHLSSNVTNHELNRMIKNLRSKYSY